MFIYKIEHKESGMKYIGQTTRSVEERWKKHFVKNKCTRIYRALMKYGIDAFTIETIDTANNMDELNQKEKYWIEYYNSMSPNGYNLRSGGNNSIHSLESVMSMYKPRTDNYEDRYIRFDKAKYSYVVEMTFINFRFTRGYADIKDAIEVRDNAEKTRLENPYITEKDMCILYPKRISNTGHKFISLVKDNYYRFFMEKNKKRYFKFFTSIDDAIAFRDFILPKINAGQDISEYFPKREPKTGHKYIYLNNRGSYSVQIDKNGFLFRKRFINLDDAIKWRDERLKEISYG